MPVISREQAIMVGRWLGAHSALGQARGTVLKWLLDAGDKQVGGRRGGGEKVQGYMGSYSQCASLPHIGASPFRTA